MSLIYVLLFLPFVNPAADFFSICRVSFWADIYVQSSLTGFLLFTSFSLIVLWPTSDDRMMYKIIILGAPYRSPRIAGGNLSRAALLVFGFVAITRQ